jgi:hypothetical protein
VREFAAAAKLKCETLRTEADVFDVWASFVVSAECLCSFQPHPSAERTAVEEHWLARGVALIVQGKDLVSYMVRARVPMPKSTREYIERCQRYAGTRAAPAAVVLEERRQPSAARAT